MSEQPRPPAAKPTEESSLLEETLIHEQVEPSPREEWSREDDELLLLDEIEDETPDDNIGDLV